MLDAYAGPRAAHEHNSLHPERFVMSWLLHHRARPWLDDSCSATSGTKREQGTAYHDARSGTIAGLHTAKDGVDSAYRTWHRIGDVLID